MALLMRVIGRQFCSEILIKKCKIRNRYCLKHISEQTFLKRRAAFYLSLRGYSSLNDKNCSKSDAKDDECLVNTKVKSVGIFITHGPFGWLRRKFNLWRLKKYFDHDFDKEEFLKGAKHAFCTISAIICEARLGELDGLAHPTVINTIRRAVFDGIRGIPIEAKEILAAQVGGINFGAVDEKDVVDVEVTFVCDFADRISSQRVGNVKIFNVREPRVVLYIFRKERSLSDLKGSWFVMGIKDSILGIQTEYSPA